MTTKKLTNKKLKKWIQGKLNAKDKIKHGCWGANDIEAYNQLLSLLEEPKDEDVEHALEKLKFIPPEKNYYNFNSKDLETIRKALIHYGNMPKEAYNFNGKGGSIK